ncbi:MAG: aminotransferase class V-fold PLP-dependent enzyme [Alphaproteobacteria bacterium]
MSGAFDLARARAETPGCREVVHLNNAGAALMPLPVIGAVQDHLWLEATIGGYEAAAAAAGRMDHAYAAVARLVGGASDEIALVENATRAWDMAFYALDLKPGDAVITGMAEYASNYLAFLQRAQRDGIEIRVAPDDGAGRTDPDGVARLIDGRTRLIAITHVPTNGGLVNPAAEIGAVAAGHGLPFLLDACQSVGQMPVDVARIGCTMLSATGRKFLRGPRGTGFLWVRRDWTQRLHPPFVDLLAAEWTGRESYALRQDARRFETWESFVAGRLGLAAAADYAMAWGLEAIAARARMLADRLRAGLAAIPGARLHDKGVDKAAIVGFSLAGRDPAAVQRFCAARRVNLSTSSLASTRLDMDERGLDAINRASPHYYNSEDEIDAALQALADCARTI